MKPIDDIDIRLLKLFLAIADSGGFSAAQYQLNMHQSSISKKMSDLETRLGMTLCQRGRGGFNLTSDGLKVYETSKKLFGHIDDFQDEINNIRNVSSGNIHIGLIDNLVTNTNCYIQSAINQFCGKYSKVNINTHIHDSGMIEKSVLDNKFDIGITSPEVFKNGLKYIYIFNEQQSLYCTPSHPILSLGRTVTADDILSHPVVDRGLAHPVTPLNHINEHIYKSKAINMEATAHMILSGYFVGYLPDHYAQIWLENHKMVRIPIVPELEYKPKFYLTMNESQELSCAAKALVSAIVEAHDVDAIG